jgi:putative membrane protein
MRAIVATLAVLAVAATGAFAQQQKAPSEALTFAKKVAASNTFEIKSSELAQERAQSSEVKSFAQQMIADHTKAGNEFKSTLQSANITPPPEEPDAKQKATLSKLSKAKGKAFDQAYVNAQLQAHQEAVSLFRNYSKAGKTEPLKNFAAKTLPTLEHHLHMVQGLKKGGAQQTKK